METIGKYQVEGKIGAGGFAVVYKGHDPLIKRPVAIKVCFLTDEETRQRFYREAEIAGQLVHRNITTIYDFGIHEQMPYLVEEYLSGEDLTHAIKRREPQDLGTRIRYLLQIVEGLDYAHQQGVIHRDIKPGNIRVLDSGVIKLMDFGTAKFANTESNLTQSGMTLGTIAYLSPERLLGKPSGLNSDLFSFGVLAYELLAFRSPFAARKIPDLIEQVLHFDPAPLDVVWEGGPPNLARIVTRALAKDPRQRYGTSRELLADLRAVANSLGISTLATEVDTQRFLQPSVTAQVPGLLDRARELFTEGKLQRSRVLLAEVLDIEPEHAEALALRSDIDMAIGREAPPRARVEVETKSASAAAPAGDRGGSSGAGGSAPPDPPAAAIGQQEEAVLLVRSYLDRGALPQAIEALGFVQRIFGEVPETRSLLSEMRDAIKIGLQGLEETRERAGRWILDRMVAIHRRERLDLESATVLSAWLEQLLPEDSSHRSVLSQVRFRERSVAEAEEALQRERLRNEALAAIRTLLQHGDSQAALQALDFALERYGEFPEARALRDQIEATIAAHQ